MDDSTFEAIQREAGAVFPENPGMAPRALHFGDPAGEYAAAKNECALFELSDRTQFEITGADRVQFLHNYSTNDIKRLAPGEGCEAFITNIKGRVLGHVFVFVEEDSIWLETVAGAAEPLLAHLGKYALVEEVELHDRSAEYGELLVSGPGAVEKVQAMFWEEVPLHQYGHREFDVNPDVVPFRGVRRVDLLGEEGILVIVQREAIADCWKRMQADEVVFNRPEGKPLQDCSAEELKIGSKPGLRPAGAEAFHALRIEARMPLYGVDISEENLAQEVGRNEQAISFTKGCYLGQEPIARLDAMGHVNRQLCRLRLEGGAVPPPGTAVCAEEGGDKIGRITSAALSYSESQEGTPVALAYLKSGFFNAGTAVSIVSEGEPVAASVF